MFRPRTNFVPQQLHKFNIVFIIIKGKIKKIQSLHCINCILNDYKVCRKITRISSYLNISIGLQPCL